MSQKFGSLQKGLDILCAFDLDHRELTAQEISARVNIPLSSTYKYLDVLLEKGMLSRGSEPKKYTLGLTVFKMINVCAVGKKLTETALPEMTSLAETTGETVFLTVAKERDSICIEKIESKQFIKIGIELGTIRPLYAGSSGKALLAYQDEAYLSDYFAKNEFFKLTKNTVIDKNLIVDQLNVIRQEGVAISDSEVDMGAIGVSAPIFDHKKTVVAALTVAAPRERAREFGIDRLSVELKEAARNISSALGYYSN